MNPEESKNTGDLTKPRNTLGNSISSALFYHAILFFIIGFNFSDVMVGNWYQQFMPNLNGRTISDIFFLDSLNGFAVTGHLSSTDTSFILKTTNKGDNWSIIYNNDSNTFTKVKFLNQNTGFVGGLIRSNFNYYLLKTTNGGNDWSNINTPAFTYQADMYVLNEDTIWFVMDESISGGVFLTTNGGVNWQNQLEIGSNNPDRIYMYNARIGFVSGGGQLRKTTNSGQNWNLLSGTGTGAFSDLFFIDSLTGWKAIAVGGGGWIMGKSTDGGINWINQPLPTGNFLGQGIVKFLNVDNDTIWGVGEALITGGSPPARGILHRTTNGGNNWLFQVPDTSIHIVQYWHGKMINLKFGWAYHVSPTGIHTTTGGDPIWYTGIQQINDNIPESFELKQNYPNPFNPRTVIPYKLKKAAFVRLIAYEVTGKETQIMVDQHQQPGEYEVDFIGKFAVSSGIYFYRMEVTDDNSKQLFTETKKMVLLK